jgi:hypothetical protein
LVRPLASSIWHDILLTREDTRTVAKQWIEANIPAGSTFAVDWPVYGPPLGRDRYTVKEIGGLGLSRHPLAWYRERDVDYLVTSSFIHDLALLDKELEAKRDTFYASLDSESGVEQVKEFSPSAAGAEPPFVFDELYGRRSASGSGTALGPCSGSTGWSQTSERSARTERSAPPSNGGYASRRTPWRCEGWSNRVRAWACAGGRDAASYRVGQGPASFPITILLLCQVTSSVTSLPEDWDSSRRTLARSIYKYVL